MSIYQIPVTNLPNQTFNTSIPNKKGDNITWVFKFGWNFCSENWEMSLFRDTEENPIALNIPVLVSNNLLKYMSYKEDLGQIRVINLGKSKLDKPGRSTLGSDYIILWDNLDGETVA